MAIRLFEVVHRIELDEQTRALLECLLSPQHQEHVRVSLHGLSQAISELVELVNSRNSTLEIISSVVVEVKETMPSKEELESALKQILNHVTKIGDDLSAHLDNIQKQNEAGNDINASLALAQQIAARLQSIDDVLPERMVPTPVDTNTAGTGGGGESGVGSEGGQGTGGSSAGSEGVGESEGTGTTAPLNEGGSSTNTEANGEE